MSKKFRVVQMQPHSRTGRPVPKSTLKQDSKVWKFYFEKKVPRAKRVFGTFELVYYEVSSEPRVNPARIYEKIFVREVRLNARYKAAIGGLGMQCGVLSCDPCPWARWACRIYNFAHGDPFGLVFGSADTSQRVPNTCTGPELCVRVMRVFETGHGCTVWRIKYI